MVSEHSGSAAVKSAVTTRLKASLGILKNQNLENLKLEK
jgi:hypothetical protein